MPRIIEVNDLGADGVDVYSRLTEAQLRNRLEPSKGIFIAESPKVIRTALGSGCKPISFLIDREHINGETREILSDCGEVPVYSADSDTFANLTGYKLTHGMLCAMRRPKSAEPAEICAGARRAAVLDGIVDATNVGAIFRSAAALNIDAVLVTQTCCDPLNRRAVRVSMGTVFQVPWAYIDGIADIKTLGFKAAAMALSDNSLSIDDPALAEEKRLAVVLGTEGNGLSAEVIGACDYVVRIPMAHGVDSLNVAAASAVAFWELRAR